MRNLRAAIKPNTSPQVYLPDEFRTDTSELADGTIVVLDEYNRPVRQKGAASRRPKVLEQHDGDGDDDSAPLVVEVKETLPEGDLDEQQAAQRAMAIELLQQETEEAEGSAPRDEGGGSPDDAGPPPVAPWEVRAEGVRPGEVENPDDESKKPVSRAERRRLIKEEILRLSHGEQPVYYQRRLW